MDCPHHYTCGKKVPTSLKRLTCAVCKSNQSPWLCLSCGLIHCGRYINGHAKQHYAGNEAHCIAIDCHSLDAYCYSCDEYVRNDFVPRSIFDKLNAINELELAKINSSSGALDNDEIMRELDNADESLTSSRIPSTVSPEFVDESNCSSNFSTSNDDGRNKTTKTCDHNSYSRKRNVIEFGGSGDNGNNGIINNHSTGNSRTRTSSTSNNKNNQNVGVGRNRIRSNNGRFQSVRNKNNNNPNSSNNNRGSPNTNGLLQRNLRKKSGESINNNFMDDLDISVDDGVSDSKKRKLNSTDESRSPGSKSDNNKNNNSSNSNPKNLKINNNSRRAKENESIDINKAHKHGIVGLRNLGNTCFMNSVLQSLSKINQFSCYMSHIPPPDELKSTISSAFSVSNSKPFVYSTRSRKNLLLASQNSIISNNLDTVDMNSEEFLTSELRKILILLNTKGSAAVSPDGLFTIIWEVMPRFRGYQQQDAHEFLRYMLDRLHIELIHFFPSWGLMATKSKLNEDTNKNGINGSNNRENVRHRNNSESYIPSRGYKVKGSIVTTMFGGTLQNEVRCCVCGVESKKNDPFLDLSLDIPMSPTGEAKLEDCLSRFVDIEELSDADKYFCSNCKTHQKSTKRFWIRRLPNVLCLHLKRFRWANYLRTKLDHYVQFPLTSLDMTEYLLRNNHTTRGSSDTNMYDLAAVIVHHGTGVGTGHYTAFAKNDGQWYHFNDSTVKPSEESMVAKCKAYILFYTKNEVKS